jgi:hypothetical protein
MSLGLGLGLNKNSRVGGGDSIIPTFTVAPNATNIAYDSYDIEGTCSEDCDVYSLLVVRGATQPSNAVIIATGETDADVGAGFSITHSALDSGTQYDSWVVAVDTSANESVAVKVEVDTIYLDPALLASARLILDTDEEYLSVRTAAQFTAANSEYLSSLSADFNKLHDDFSYGGWVYFDTISAACGIIGKWRAGLTNHVLIFNQTSGKIEWYYTGAGLHLISTVAISTGTWYHVSIYHDGVNDEVGISVNNETFVTAAFSNGMAALYPPLDFGTYSLANYLNGRLDSPFFYDKAISQTENATMYNAGAGQNYYDMDKVGLVSFWSLNETSGTRYDMHGGNHLTDNNTVTYADGKVLDRGQDVEVFKAAQFTSANSEYLSADGTPFKVGKEDYSFGCWINMTSSSMGMGQWTAPGKSTLLYNSGSAFTFFMSPDGNVQVGVSQSGLNYGNWNFVVAVYDSVAELQKISVNGATFTSISNTDGSYLSSEEFWLGRFAATYTNGLMDSAFFYNKALSQAEVTTLYAAGAGQNYSEIDKTSLLAFWALDEVSGNRSDSHTGGYTLTDNNTVTQAEGHVSSTQTLYDISYWNDRSGQSNHFEQATPASRPSYNSVTGKITMVAASSEFLACINGATPFASDTQGEIIVVAARKVKATNRAWLFGIGLSSTNSDYNVLTHESVANGGAFTQFCQNTLEGQDIAKYLADDNNDEILIYNSSSNITRVRLGINNVELPVEYGGGNNGEWMEYATGANISYIGRFCGSAGLWSDIDIQAVYYFNAELSTADRDEVMAWINNKYSVYTPITSYADLGADLKLNIKMPKAALVLDGLRNEDELTAFTTYFGLSQNSLIDQSEELTVKAPLYHSDFTTAGDAWAALTGTPTIAYNQTFMGEAGWLKITSDGTAGTNVVWDSHSVAERTLLKTHRMRFKIGIPSTNSSVDGVVLGRVANGQFSPILVTPTQDTIYQTDWIYAHNHIIQNSFTCWLQNTSANVDVVYLKDIECDELDGHHFNQVTGAAQPAWDNTGLSIDFDGVADYMSDLGGALFTAISADTQGEWIVLFDDDAGTGVPCYPLAIDDGSAANYMVLGISSANTIAWFQNNPSNVVNFGAIARSVETEISISSSGTAYKAFDKFVEKAVAGGTDNGSWHGDIAGLTKIKIGLFQAAVFYAFGLKRLIYINRQLGMDERRQFKKFRDNE